MKEKTLFGMLNDDYRESVLKENEMKKVRTAIREKSRLKKLNESNKRKLKESVNINVSPDGNVNVNVEEPSTPVVPEPAIEEPVEEVQEEIIEDAEKTCEGCGKPISECSCKMKEAGAELNVGAKVDVPDDLASAVGTALLAASDTGKDADEELKESEEAKEELQECEISSYKVTRIAPNTNAYMIEAQTKEGLKYIIGKNFNESEKTLEEAEILDNKVEASNKFRGLLK